MHPNNKIFLGAVSAALIGATVLWEGDVPKQGMMPYKDIVGVLTTCHGYAAPDVVMRHYTKTECTYLLRRELAIHGQGMLNCVNVPLTQYQYDAFTLFTYNVGVGAFCGSKSVLKPLNEGNYAQACKGLLRWSYAGGKYVQGLNNRRQYEYKMCMGKLNAK